MESYLIDTNVVSDYMSASLPVKGLDFLDEVMNDIPNLSVISQIELLCWKTDPKTEQNVKSLISDSVVLNITPEIIHQCVILRKGKRIKTPDAIIAATAMVHNLTLITRDGDFANIQGLKILNPISI